MDRWEARLKAGEDTGQAQAFEVNPKFWVSAKQIYEVLNIPRPASFSSVNRIPPLQNRIEPHFNHFDNWGQIPIKEAGSSFAKFQEPRKTQKSRQIEEDTFFRPSIPKPECQHYSEDSEDLANEVQITVSTDCGDQIELFMGDCALVAEVVRKTLDQLSSKTGSKIPNNRNEYALFQGECQLSYTQRLYELDYSGKKISLTLLQCKDLDNRHFPLNQIGTFLPKLSKPGYETEPSFAAICQLDENQLSCIEDLAIKNPWGRIHFPGDTDIRGLNLDKIVNIEKGVIEIYPEGSVRPPRGQGLNKQAIFTFYQFGLKNKENIDRWISKIKDKTIRLGGSYLGHDQAEDSITILVDGSNF